MHLFYLILFNCQFENLAAQTNLLLEGLPAMLHTVGSVWPRAEGLTASLRADLDKGQLACAVTNPGSMGSES